jgi:Protein of unknown function (DUF1569)
MYSSTQGVAVKHNEGTAVLSDANGTSLTGELFTSNFWLSGLAILKYIPRSLQVKQVDGLAFFTTTKHDEFRDRILRITPANARQWGTMSVSQMLHHLNLACGSSLGFYNLPDESYLLSGTLFRWILVDWFPEQPEGLRVPKGFKIPHDAQFDFAFEKEQLLKILDAAWHARSPGDWRPHCMFGKMSAEEWGKLLQIHIDYHLKQFAA